jgi:type IV secretory pathway VirB10-like protein
MKVINKTIALGLLLSLAGGTILNLKAEEPEAPPPATPAPPATPTVPETPAAPTTPTTPATPALPAPTAPATPASPATPVATPKRPIQQQLAGKVVAIDRAAKTVTLQVNNLTYVLEIADSTKISKSGKERNLADVIVGEEISVTVLLRELPNGRVEVAVLSVELPEGAEAQGGRGRGFAQPPPFQNGPNPGNVDGPIISPAR